MQLDQTSCTIVLHLSFQGLPYRVHQRQVSRRQLADGSMRIEMELAVDTEGQRGILVGQGGQSIC